MTIQNARNSEEERLRILREYPLIPEGSAQLDSIARLAATICRTPIALISLVEESRQVFVGRFGLETPETPRDHSFCALCMLGGDTMIVSDATRDARFDDNPLVTGDPHIRFYAGQPLISPEGQPLGSLCVIDRKPREGLDPSQKDAMITLAHLVVGVLEGLRRDAHKLADERRSRSQVAELEQRFALLADSLPQLVWSTLPDGQSDYFNRPWCEFTGLPAEASYGAGWLGFLHPEDAPLAAQVWTDAVKSGEVYEVRYRLRRHDGVYRWVIARGLPLKGSQDQVTRWIGTCTDIQDEMATADALELLSQELNHRIKNIFALIGGLISLSSRSHPDAGDFAQDLYDRVLALGRAHGFIGSRGTSGDRIGKTRLKEMLGELLAPYETIGSGQIAITGDDIDIDDRSATPLALVFHELTTNSAKYGAIASENGTVEIALTAGDPVRLLWIERGGKSSGEHKAKGFGSRLVDMSITRQLGGVYDMRWQEGRLEIEIRVPLANITRV